MINTNRVQLPDEYVDQELVYDNEIDDSVSVHELDAEKDLDSKIKNLEDEIGKLKDIVYALRNKIGLESNSDSEQKFESEVETDSSESESEVETDSSESESESNEEEESDYDFGF